MNIREQVFKILAAFGRGDACLRREDWTGAILQYAEATDTLMRLPESEPFDRLCFVASCLAGIAVANIALQDYMKGLQCAEEALSFFDRAGNMYPAERGKWLLAILAKGIACLVLGRTVEAEKCRQRAKQMLAGSPGKLNFRAEIDQFLEALEASLRGDRAETKGWWQFWK